MAMEKVILSIDCGTQSLRALLFSFKGELLDKYKVSYEPYHSLQPGWAEQDPEQYWDSLCRACQALKTRSPALFENIAGVGVTTLRASMVNVDAHGNPLRPTMVWLDQRKADPVYEPGRIVKLGLKMVGMEEPFIAAQRGGKGNWIQQNEPEVWEKTHKYMQVSGFLNHRLTGEFADSIASQIGHIPFHYKKLRWGKPRDFLHFAGRCFPVEPEKLPYLVQPGGQIGKVIRKAAEQTGIAEGIPVIACGSDKGCETIGMGVLDRSVASLSFGTTATVQCTSRKYFETIPFMPPYPAPIPGHYNPEVEIFRGYWMISWFKKEFAYPEVLQAMEKGIPPEVALNGLLKEAPAGSMGLVVQPYWSPGLKEPAAKGAMIGFGDVHKRAHVYRAVIEGLAYGLLDGMQKMEKRGKSVFKRLAVSGGASQSDEICQISSDVMNLPLVRGKTFETSGLGAALVTAKGLGIYPSFETAIKEMVHYGQEFEPNQDNAILYHELFKRVYQKIYHSLQPLYEEIRAITGYPEK